MTRTATYIILFTLVLTACKRDYVPKPRGYFRIDLPEKEFVLYHKKGCPYSFEVPAYTKVKQDQDANSEPCWVNIEFINYNATLHISYKPVIAELDQLIEDSHTLAYKHSIKANSIDEQLYVNPEKEVYGILYNIGGNAATSVQFYVTDSVQHYLRGSLYFNSEPNADSLAPVINAFREDIIHLMESLNWE